MIKSYSELTIDKYYQICDVFKIEGLEDIDIQVKILSILNDVDENSILNLKLDKYSEYVDNLDFLFDMVKPKKRNINIININGKKYRLMKQPEKMTAGQFIDFQTYIDNKLGIEFILSTILIPEGKKYGDYDVVDIINDIKEYLDIQTAEDICFFFRKKLLNSIKGFLICLDWMTRNRKLTPEMKEKMKKVRTEIRQMLSSLNGNTNI